MIMRRFFIGLLLCASIGWAGEQSKVDFKNFSYPWRYHSGWPARLQWLDSSEQHRVQLVNGRWTEEQEANGPFSGLTLEEVQLADVTGDGQAEAIVILRYDTGGTQFSHYVYIYSLAERNPKLLASFHSGDRAASVLYRIYGQKGKLIVELFDPQKGEGDCCSLGFVRTRYKWSDGKFVAVGPQEFGKPKAPSRLPVTVFGTHQ
jgi:hypothetical protein